MKTSIKSSDLHKLPPERQDEEARRLLKVARGVPNGEQQDLDNQIRQLEEKFKVSSKDLRRELAQGKRPETWEICKWLLLLDQRELLGLRSPRSR